MLRARARDARRQRSAWASATVRFGGARALPQGFTKDEAWVTGLCSATAFAQAPDGRIFVAEQGGALRVVKNGALLADAVLQLAVDSTGERGLIGVALHPDFAINGFVYVYYTRTDGGDAQPHQPLHGDRRRRRVGRQRSRPGGPADLSSATNHNGGAMHFGTDGKLYVGVGDNANGAQAQDLTTPFGKLLRFNDDGTIPTDNPFYATQTGLARAVWAYGLRNPFTFAVQPGTGRIHINDVGAGHLGGDQPRRGRRQLRLAGSEGPDNVGAGITAPLFTYKHSAASPPGSGPGGFFTGFAIAGGASTRPDGPFPAGLPRPVLLRRLRQPVRRPARRWQTATPPMRSPGFRAHPVDLLVGIDGALYVLTRSGITRISAP